MITNPTDAQVKAALSSMEDGVVSLDLFVMADAVAWWTRAQWGDALAISMVEVMPSIAASVRSNHTVCLCCDRQIHELGAAALMSRDDCPSSAGRAVRTTHPVICYHVCVPCADLPFEDLRLRILIALGQIFPQIREIRDDRVAKRTDARERSAVLHSPGHA